VIHEAFLYRSDKDFAARLIPFLHDALASGQGAIAVTTEARIALLRRGLGADADDVAFFDATRWYRRPGAALAAWRDTFDQQSRDGVEFVCAVGEVQFAGGQTAIRNWTRYESLLNRAFADRSAWIVCPYNTQSLPGEIVSEARRTHPTTSTKLPGRAPSPAHFETHELGAPLALADDRPKAEERTRVEFSQSDDLREVRRNVRWEAQSAGLEVDVVDDLLLAVTELVEGSRRGATGVVRTARQSGEWFCEVGFDSSAADTLPLNAHDLGVLIGRVISDRVEIADDGGQLVRFVFGKQSADPRQRIVTAASELFRTNGVRPTGINAVIAHAGVAKATFYAYFQSKDDLIRFWLASPAARWFDQVRSEIELRTTTPAERLTTFFDVLGEWLMEDDFRGCPFLNTATEFRNADRSFTQELADLTAEIEDYFQRSAAEAGFVDPDGIAQELFLLVPGTITTATARASAEPARVARATAERIIASTPITR
jgi:AcrR family transcriptional regulator